MKEIWKNYLEKQERTLRVGINYVNKVISPKYWAVLTKLAVILISHTCAYPLKKISVMMLCCFIKNAVTRRLSMYNILVRVKIKTKCNIDSYYNGHRVYSNINHLQNKFAKEMLPIFCHMQHFSSNLGLQVARNFNYISEKLWPNNTPSSKNNCKKKIYCNFIFWAVEENIVKNLVISNCLYLN